MTSRRFMVLTVLVSLLILISVAYYTMWKSPLPLSYDMNASELQVYELERPRRWGGIGATLIGGDSERDPNGNLLVYRAGPFMPPIALPGMGTMTVSDEFRSDLDHSGMFGLKFFPAVKRRVVEIHWRHWDPLGEPGDLPKAESLHDLLHGLPHSDAISASLGPIWDARTDRLVHVALVEDPNRRREGYELRITEATNDLRKYDFFGAVNQDRVFVSAKAKRWLDERVSEWINIRPVLVDEATRFQ